MAQTARGWLLQLARRVRDELKNAANPYVVTAESSSLEPWETDTDGWYVTVAKVQGVRGELQLWLDATPNAEGRRVSASFTAKTNTAMVEAVAKAGIGALGPPLTFTKADWVRRPDGVRQLRRPLPANQYGVPIAELYGGDWWRFYTMYWPDAVNPAVPASPKFVGGVVAFLGEVVQVLTSLAVEQVDRAYPKVKNRSAVVEHLRRERSQKLARLARARDGYRCKVCNVEFGKLYGKLGAGFAEVHHRIALASPKAPKVTRLKDLVTVCANCHRMLHRMKGTSTDVQRLQKLFTGKWPKTPA
jgi:5-methylcytosine-specific restriction endonuclease McrA